MTNTAIYPSLHDRAVLITGGGSGIGAELVAAFVRQKARVAFIDIADEVSNALVNELRDENSEHVVDYYHCDIRDIEALRQIVNDIETKLHGIDVLINNAACDDRHDWREVTPEYWDERIAINLRPHFFTIQAVAPGMQQRGYGSIINFGSVSWKRAQSGMPGYVTSKAAVHGLTRTMARELGADGIRVNTVIPGPIMTQRQLDKWIKPEDETYIQGEQCLKQRLLPEHLAPIALFLAADDSAQSTSQEFVVDGGMT